jgi:hypothetical protein
MNKKTLITVTPRSDRTIVAGGLVTFAATAALLLAPVAAQAAGSGPAGPSAAVTFEKIPGSAIKRVILTAKAAERLGIELGEVSEKTIIRKQMFGGQVIHQLRVRVAHEKARGAFGGFARVAASPAPKPGTAKPTGPMAGEAWIRLALSEDEWARVAKDKPARVLPLATRTMIKRELTAVLSELPALEDPKRTMLTLYYVVKGKDHGLTANNRMRVELQLKGSGKIRKVVPYSALYYDGKGTPWVYVSTKKLTFERKRVEVERIEGESAVLKSGPEVGTRVATVGVALLYGAEVIFKR